MKLFLTSGSLPPETTEPFLKLLGKKPEESKVCFIATASFAKHPKGDAQYVKKDKERLSELGFKIITEVDLRKENEESLNKKLKNFNVIFVEGGNTFYLLKYVRESGFDKALESFLDRGGIYLGVSAGSIIMGLNIKTESYPYEPMNENIVNLKDLTGLRLVPFIIAPHLNESNAETIKREASKGKYPVVALTDKQAILVDNGKIQFIGPGEFKQFK